MLNLPDSFYFRSSLTRGGCVIAVSEIAVVKTLDLKKVTHVFVTCILYLNFVWRVCCDIFMYSFAWVMHVNIMDVIVYCATGSNRSLPPGS